MDHSLVARISTEFLIGFSALFSLINPLGMAFVFAEKTRTLPDEVRANLARSVASYSLVLILSAMLLGAPILAFFGIGLPALRIAGGLLVALAGYGMLTAPDVRDDEDVARSNGIFSTNDAPNCWPRDYCRKHRSRRTGQGRTGLLRYYGSAPRDFSSNISTASSVDQPRNHASGFGSRSARPRVERVQRLFAN